MKRLAFVFLAVLATVLLSLGLSWLLHLASQPRNLDVAAGLGGAVVLFFLYWEVLTLCVKGFRLEIRKTNQDTTPTPKELQS
jgi:phosphate starvation-inducible membrane PsiE